MPCNAAYYRYVLDGMVKGFSNCEKWLEQILGHEWLAYVVIAAIIVPVTFSFGWAQYVLIPKFVRWYYGETIVGKAMNWFTRNGLAFIGFRHSTAIISVVAGAGFYVLVRAAVAFPPYLIYTIPALVGIFIAISILGYFVSGSVPGTDAARNRYFKRFYSPTVTGLGLAIGTLILDFLINATAIIVNMLQLT